MFILAYARYLGVVIGPETYDVARQAFSSSKVAFEWSVGDAQSGRTEVVIASCYNAVRPGGVPAPKFAGSISAAELERLATAAGLDRDASHEQYGQAVDKVDCRYLGVLKDDGSADPSVEAMPQSQLAFEFLFYGGGGIQVHPIKVKCAKVMKGAGLVESITYKSSLSS